MSTTKHTPGPWRTVRTVIAWRHDKAEAVVGASHRSVCYLHWADREAEEVNANARLIADAPALLDALAEVIRYDDLTQPCDHAPDPESCTHCRARELVAKHKEMRNA